MLLIIGGTIALALLLIIGGIVYERVWRPSQAVRSVNGTTLTQGGYGRSRPREYAAPDGPDAVLQHPGRLQSELRAGRHVRRTDLEGNAQLDAQTNIRNREQRADEASISSWIDSRIVEQGAAAEYDIDPPQGEIDQAIVAQFGGALDSPVVTDTTTASPAGSPEASPAASADASVAAEASAAAETSPAASAEPSATPEPTATPGPDEATGLVDRIAERLYTEYDNIMGALPEEATAQQKQRNLTQAMLAATLRAQFREQVIQQQVKQALVPELPGRRYLGARPDQYPAYPAQGTGAYADARSISRAG